MSSVSDNPFGSTDGDGDVALNRRECPHCQLWFGLDAAKIDAKNKLRCPYCGWEVQSAV